MAELEPKYGIRVNAVAPGLVKTPIWNEEELAWVDESVDTWVARERVAGVMLELVEGGGLRSSLENKERFDKQKNLYLRIDMEDFSEICQLVILFTLIYAFPRYLTRAVLECWNSSACQYVPYLITARPKSISMTACMVHITSTSTSRQKISERRPSANFHSIPCPQMG
jgi:hypothetical protein